MSNRQQSTTFIVFLLVSLLFLSPISTAAEISESNVETEISSETVEEQDPQLQENNKIEENQAPPDNAPIDSDSATSTSPIYKGYINDPVSTETLSQQGSLTTDLNTGAAIYTYPFKLPPGTNGLTPTLALIYNSHNTNSYPELTGSAWSLTESYIQRDTEHTRSDTTDDTFKLILNGITHDLVGRKLPYQDRIPSAN
jgi:hypothetical protein